MQIKNKKITTETKQEEKEIMEAEIIVLDGTPTQLKAIDFNKDGETGGIEILEQESNLMTSTTPTELGDTIREMNKDEIDIKTRMSSVDMKANISEMDLLTISAFDSLVWLECMPIECLAVTRKMLRLSVSKDALGRQNAVDIATGQRNHQREMQTSKLASFFKIKKKEGMDENK